MHIDFSLNSNFSSKYIDSFLELFDFIQNIYISFKMKTLVEEKFSDFYEKWMAQLEDLLELLVVVSKEPPQESSCAAMISKLTAHHKEYYKFKWAAAHDDVLAFFSGPVWLSPLETAYLWITGWKPSAAFRLLGAAGCGSLTEEQVKRIEALRSRMKAEEERVEREMERLQVAVADRNAVELVRLGRRGGPAAVEAAVGGFLGGLERVMKMADCVRLKTLKGLLEILNPMQSVEFLASKSMFQIRVRKFGIIERSKLVS